MHVHVSSTRALRGCFVWQTERDVGWSTLYFRDGWTIDPDQSGADRTRGVFLGGRASPANKDTIDFITIASTGNSTTFGDLSVARSKAGTGSSAHGGIQ